MFIGNVVVQKQLTINFNEGWQMVNSTVPQKHTQAGASVQLTNKNSVIPAPSVFLLFCITL